MKSHIEAIIIFSKTGEKRMIPLQEGVNIITGDSKTGKSALIEIIDYCLCSTNCTIPKGKITDFSELYALIMKINTNIYVIARYNWNSGGKMFFIKEKENFDFRTLKREYFEKKIKISPKEAQNEIENALGLSVTNVNEDESQQAKKASLRNMVSYLFQHQNLMASKFALFYRFSDFYKRKDVIEQFPIFAGIIDQEYYSTLIKLNSLKSKLKQSEKRQKNNQNLNNHIKEKLQPLLINYFALLNRSLEENLSIEEMLKVASNLPKYDDNILGEAKVVSHYNNLRLKLEELREKERNILLEIENINSTKKNGVNFSKILEELEYQTKITENKNKSYSCPLCGSNCNEINVENEKISKASKWLDTELKLAKKYTFDFSEDIRKLEENHKELEREIKIVYKELKNVEKKFLSSDELKTKMDKVNYAKANIEIFVELNEVGIFENIDEEIEILKANIRDLEKKIRSFDVYEQKEKAELFLSKNMNRLAQTLDFENEYKPINLNFDLVNDNFDLYHSKENNEKIYLSEMGSGANWVSCHIALFLSFLHYFSKQPNSPMPLIMFFDQPSQVYFPQNTVEKNTVSETDLVAVNKIYKTIFDEIKLIGEETRNLPQIIIVDHVDGEGLKNQDEFKKYIRCNWRNGKALI